jgi:hypothetical protein
MNKKTLICNNCDKESELIIGGAVPASWYFFQYTMRNGYFFFMAACSTACGVAWEKATSLNYSDRALLAVLPYAPEGYTRAQDDPMWHARDFEWLHGRPKWLDEKGHRIDV